MQAEARLVVDDVLLTVEQLRPAWAAIAAATRGWAWPVFVTPIPEL